MRPLNMNALLLILLAIASTSSEKLRLQQQNFNGIDRRRDISLKLPGHQQQQQQQHQQQQTTSGCGSCKMREELKTRNLEAIKGEVLRRMGFHSAPNVTGRVLPEVPPHMLAKIDPFDYGGMQGDQPVYKTGPGIVEEEDDYHMKTEIVVTFAQQYPRLRHSSRGHDVLHFQFTDAITKYHVANATLFVYVKGTDRRPTPAFNLEIFKVVRRQPHGGGSVLASGGDSPDYEKVYSRKVTQPYGRGEWVQADVTSMVGEWFKGTRDNLGFVVNGTVGAERVVYTGNPNGPKNGVNKIPYVEITTREAKRRTRRNIGLNCDERSNESLCCRYPLTVDFEEFGWDFIIAPKRYEAHYCSGECPYITLQKHAHTHLMQMASPNTAGPCCAPRKMSPISMLYFDAQTNVVYGSLPGMVVDRCGCA